MSDDNAMAARAISLLVIIICSLAGVTYPLFLVAQDKDVRSTEW